MNDTSIFVQLFIYSLIFATIFISFYIYKLIQKNIKQQEYNNIQLSINELISKMKNSSDDVYIKSLSHKIDVLKQNQENIFK